MWKLWKSIIIDIIETLAAEFPDITIAAYVDDINLASHDTQLLSKAFVRLKELLAAEDLLVSTEKCVWFSGVNKEPLPDDIRDAGVRNEEDALKTLGAFIGDDDKVSEKLLSTFKKHDAIFRRLKLMGANNVSTQLLSKCVNVRQTYHMRVHNPTATEALTFNFDNAIAEVLTSWFGKLSDDQISLLRLPVKKGGLGLTACLPTRKAAYESSKFTVLERPKTNSVRTGEFQEANANMHKDVPVDESTQAAEIHAKTWVQLTESESPMASILQATTHKGNYAWIMSSARFVPSHLFTLALLPRLGLTHPELPPRMLCPGCKVLLTSGSILTHIAGCTKCSGLNATVKHSTLVNFLYELSLKAGIPCEKEPRLYSTYRCTQCNEVVGPEYRQTHSKVCGGKSFRRSGPDLVIYWNDGEIYYDFTVVHELAPSNLGTKCNKLFRDAIKRKHDTYVATNKIAKEKFRCIPILSGGSLHFNTKSLLMALADAGSVPRQQLQLELQLLLQEQNGAILYSQLRNYLEKDKGALQFAI